MYRLAPKKWGVPAIFGGNRYLVPLNGGIATTSVRTGLAMTGNRESARQTPICRMAEESRYEHCFIICAYRLNSATALKTKSTQFIGHKPKYTGVIQTAGGQPAWQQWSGAHLQAFGNGSRPGSGDGRIESGSSFRTGLCAPLAARRRITASAAGTSDAPRAPLWCWAIYLCAPDIPNAGARGQKRLASAETKPRSHGGFPAFRPDGDGRGLFRRQKPRSWYDTSLRCSKLPGKESRRIFGCRSLLTPMSNRTHCGMRWLPGLSRSGNVVVDAKRQRGFEVTAQGAEPSPGRNLPRQMGAAPELPARILHSLQPQTLSRPALCRAGSRCCCFSGCRLKPICI